MSDWNSYQKHEAQGWPMKVGLDGIPYPGAVEGVPWAKEEYQIFYRGYEVCKHMAKDGDEAGITLLDNSLIQHMIAHSPRTDTTYIPTVREEWLLREAALEEEVRQASLEP